MKQPIWKYALWGLLTAGMVAVVISTVLQDARQVSGEGRIVLTSKRLPHLAFGTIRNEADAKIFHRFLQDHPDVDVRKTSDLRIPNSPSTELLSIAGEIAPDIFYIPFEQARDYIEQGFLLDITAAIAPWQDKERIADALWPVVMKDGRYFGIPTDTVHLGLIYNRDLVREAGLDPDTPPQTWDALFQWAQVLTDRDKIMHWGERQYTGRWGLGWLLSKELLEKDTFGVRRWRVSGGEILTNLIWQLGGAIVKDGQVAYDSPEAVEAMKIIQKFTWVHWFRDKQGRIVNLTDPQGELVVTPEQFQQLLDTDGGRYTDEFGNAPWNLRDMEKKRRIIRGVINASASAEEGIANTEGFALFAPGAERCAMAIGYPHLGLIQYVQGYQLEQTYGFAPLPTVKGGTPVNLVRGYVLAVNAQVKGVDKRKVATDFITFLSSRQAEKIVIDHFVAEDWGRLIRPDWLRRHGDTDTLATVSQAWQETFRTMQARERLPPQIPKAAQIIGQEMRKPLEAMYGAQAKALDIAPALHKSVNHVNATILRQRERADMAVKRHITLGIMVVLLGGLVVSMPRIVTSLGTALGRAARCKPPAASGISHQMGAWLFLVPAVAAMALFQYYPLARGSVMALYDWKLLGEKHFVGLDNFIAILSQPDFWTVVWNTIWYVGLSIGLGFVAPILLALLLAEIPRGKLVFRVLYYLPYVTTPLVTLFLWKLLYTPGEDGFLNIVLGYVNLGPYDWLESPKMAMLCVVMPGVWAGMGVGCLIYLAALRGVPDAMYEAAEVDGAGVMAKLRHITLPYLRPLLLINFVGAVIGSFHAASNVLMLTGGGPEDATNIMGIEIFKRAFLYLQFGYATALAWILGAGLLGFTLQQLKFLKHVEFSTTE